MKNRVGGEEKTLPGFFLQKNHLVRRRLFCSAVVLATGELSKREMMTSWSKTCVMCDGRFQPSEAGEIISVLAKKLSFFTQS